MRRLRYSTAIVLAMFAAISRSVCQTPTLMRPVFRTSCKSSEPERIGKTCRVSRRGPSPENTFDQVELLDDRIEDFRRAQDLELRGDKLRIVGVPLALTGGERLVVVRPHFHGHLGQVSAREEVNGHARRDHDEQENQDDEPGAHLDDAPVVEKMEFDLAGFDHNRREPLGPDKILIKSRLANANGEFRSTGPAPRCSKGILHPEEELVPKVIRTSGRREIVDEAIIGSERAVPGESILQSEVGLKRIFGDRGVRRARRS